MRTLRLTQTAIALALACILGCWDTEEESEPHDPVAVGSALDSIEPFGEDRPIEVVCTTGMVADLVLNVAGEHVAAVHVGKETFERDGKRFVVRQLFGAGVDPHTHQPSAKDAERLAVADVVVFSGLHLEGTLTDVLDRRSRRGPTYAVTRDLPRDRLLVDESEHDPHVWMDVALWSRAAENVATLLSKLDPDHADDYAANLAAYRSELTELDTYAKDSIARIPEAQRVLVTAHDAFAYFSKAYDIEVRSIQGISTESEASVRDVNELVDFLVERKIDAVFVESSTSDRTVRSLVEGCKAKGHDVRVGGELFSDAMGEPGTDEGTYVGMIRHNVDTIVEALE